MTILSIIPLSKRESQIAEMLLTAQSMKAIAHEMGISYGTAKIYAFRFLRKSGYSTRLEYMVAERDKAKSA